MSVTIKAIKMAFWTCAAAPDTSKGFPLPPPGGDLVTAEASDGETYQLLNIGRQNLEHVMERDGITWPIEIQPVAQWRALVTDERIPKDFLYDRDKWWNELTRRVEMKAFASKSNA